VILIDTSVLSRVFRRRRQGSEEQRLSQAVQELLAGEAALGLPGIVLQEVLSGIRSMQQFEATKQRLTSSFEIVLPTINDYIAAAKLKNECLSWGISLSGPDCLIAVLALSGGHESFTLDSDFLAIAKRTPLKLYNIDRRS
jgi:predicted nucleic acid-binding protein